MTSLWLLLVTLCALWETLSCHRCQESRHSGLIKRSTFDCSSRNIRQLPVNIPSRATELNLARNNFTVVPKNAFRQLPNLTKLDLTSCGIRILEKDCFDGLLRLQWLILERNEFNPARLPRETFAGLASLQLLAIARQRVANTFPVAILEDLKELRTLSVSSQDLPLPDVYGRLPKLTTLELVAWWNRSAPGTKSDERIRLEAQTYAAIRHSNVHTLMIRGDAAIPTNPNVLSNFKNLRTLNFACSTIVNVRQIMLALGQIANTTIDTVILDGTHTFNHRYGFYKGSYDINDFCDGPLWKNLRRLSLRSLDLRTFVPPNVNCLSNLQELSIGNNPLTITTSNNTMDLHGFANLQKVDISFSNRPGPGFRYRYCRSCSVLFKAEDFFPRVPRLRRVVQPTVFDESVKDYSPSFFLSPSLRYIDASSSVFTTLSTFVRVLSFSRPNSVLFLNVSGTQTLNRVDGLLVGLHQLQVLDASHGVVESIHPEFFQHLPLLRVLNQSDNFLGKGNNNFSAIFSYARQLEDVDLSNNQMKYIDPSTFSGCTTLKHIKLRHNAFRWFHMTLDNLTSLDVLDISENRLPYLNESFTSVLDKLRETKPFSIDLRRNLFVCNCESRPFIRWVQTTLVDVIGRTDMTCLLQSSRKRLADVSVSNISADCDGPRLHVWLYCVVGILVVILVIATIAAMCKCFRRRRTPNALVYLSLNTYARGG